MAGDDAAWQVIPRGFSVKKCLHGQKHDAQTIQRWMGVRRPSKGIEVLVRDRLTHHATGASSALVCSLVTVHDQPPVILCVAREQKHSRVFVADLETGVIASVEPPVEASPRSPALWELLASWTPLSTAKRPTVCVCVCACVCVCVCVCDCMCVWPLLIVGQRAEQQAGVVYLVARH